MFLQILPPDETMVASLLDSQLIFVLIALTAGVFTMLRFVKYLSKVRVKKENKNPSYTA